MNTTAEDLATIIRKRLGNTMHPQSCFTLPDPQGMRIFVYTKSPVHPELFEAVLRLFESPRVMTPEEKLRQRARASASRHDHE